MLTPIAYAVMAGALGVAGWSVVAAARGVRPSKGQLIAAAVLEGALLLQFALGLVLMATDEGQVEAITFVGYHLTAITVLPVGVAWGIADRSRWGNGVFAIAAATETVLMVRLLQIWSDRA